MWTSFFVLLFFLTHPELKKQHEMSLFFKKPFFSDIWVWNCNNFAQNPYFAVKVSLYVQLADLCMRQQNVTGNFFFFTRIFYHPQTQEPFQKYWTMSKNTERLAIQHFGHLSLKLSLKLYVFIFYLVASWPTLGGYWWENLTHLTLIPVFHQFVDWRLSKVS